MVKLTEPSRFYDVETGGPIRLELQAAGAGFRVLRQFGYRDPDHTEPFIVPADVGTFTTDLASIPRLFAWLVPGLGTHLPAIVLHDGLVIEEGESKTYIGPDVGRDEADHILRNALASLRTPRIRRWLFWIGVAVGTTWSLRERRWWWRAVVVATVAVVGVLGLAATLDLVDVWDVLPWMGARPWWAELLGGASFAVLVPLALSFAWRSRWRVGLGLGIGLALTFHVSVILLVLYGLYWVAETVVSAPEGTGPGVTKNLDRAGFRPPGGPDGLPD